MRHEATHKRARRGYAIIIGAVLLALLILDIDRIMERFRERVDVVALVHETRGVRPGSPVVAAGVEVGRVVEVGFGSMTPAASGAVALRLRLDQAATPIVRRGSRARTANRRFVGEPVVRLTPGPTAAPAISHGDTLRPTEGVSIQRLVERGRDFPASLDSLRDALAGIQDLAADGQFDRLARRVEAVADESAELRTQLRHGSLADLGPGLTTRLRALRGRLAALVDATDGIARHAADQSLQREAARVATRAREIGARVEGLAGRTEDGALSRLQRDSALVRAIAGVTAQIDSLTSDGLGFALRMLEP